MQTMSDERLRSAETGTRRAGKKTRVLPKLAVSASPCAMSRSMYFATEFRWMQRRSPISRVVIPLLFCARRALICCSTSVSANIIASHVV
ncbi:hypothetical protein ASZ90_014910 [hydrocarbon metagenome]|uniref:Uncharacterized protein n=1 Tax=hydrocarbon metagenome TaxID=938273 RepID=A0A0W8F3G9_9ZZZZ